MWVGSGAVVASSVSAVVTGRFNDLVQGQVKPLLTFLVLSGAGCYYWFLLLSYDVLEVTKCKFNAFT